MVDNQTDTDRNDREMIVTDVRSRRNRAQPRIIYVDGEARMYLSEDICLKSGMFRGARVTERDLERIRTEEEIYQAKQTALRIVSRRMRSVKEVERKLRDKKFSPQAIETAVRFLGEYGFADDANFARAFVNEQLLRRPVGRRRLEQDLRRKGVDRETIQGTLESIAGDDELRLAMAAAEKKAASIRTEDPMKWERSLASFLAGRGFGWDAVAKVMEEMKRRREEHRKSQQDAN